MIPMKRLLTFLLTALIINANAQTVTGDRVVARQGIYVKDSWVDSVQKNGTLSSDRAIPSSKMLSNGTIKNQFNHSSDQDFEIDVFPDIQYMTRWRYAWGRSMFQWVVDNKASQNIKAVLQVGDITDATTIAEWDTASTWFNLLDGVSIPYVAAAGNHDYASTSPVGRNLTSYNSYFGASRMSTKSHFVGYFDTDPLSQGYANAFYKIDIASKKYCILNLEFLPRDTVIGWASKILDSLYNAEPSREVMVLTHAYIDSYGELPQDSSLYAGNTYGMSNDNSGQELWDKLIKKKANIRWVFNGHYIPSYNSNRGWSSNITATGENGNIIEQIFVNFQDDSDKGNGYFMRLKFKPSQNKIDVSYYSPYENAYDSLVKGFTMFAPPVDIVGKVGIAGKVAINQELRVAGDVKLEQLSKSSIPFVAEDHKLKTTDSLRFDGVSGIYASKIGTYYSKPFIIKTNNTQRALFDSIGRLAIQVSRMQVGNSSNVNTFLNNNNLDGNYPATFNVIQGSGNWGIAVTRANVDAVGANVVFLKVRSTDPTIRVPAQVGDIVGRITWMTPSADSTVHSLAQIRSSVEGVTDGGIQGNLIFCTSFNTYSSDGNERMRINSLGQVMIGTSTPFGANVKFHVAGESYLLGKVTLGDVLNLPATTAPTSSSDSSGSDGDLRKDASGNLYLKAGGQWLKFTGVTF